MFVKNTQYYYTKTAMTCVQWSTIAYFIVTEKHENPSALKIKRLQKSDL